MNTLNTKARLRILRCLLEGNGIRSTARIVGVSKGTVLKLLADVGKVCLEYHEDKMRNIECRNIQVDEIWTFIYAKKKTTPKKEIEVYGDWWTWTAVCADSKIVPCWYIGDRTTESAVNFLCDLSKRITGNYQITSDGYRGYKTAVKAHMPDKDFGMMTKMYIKDKKSKEERLTIIKDKIQGFPQLDKISTSYVERQNLSMRMYMRRFTRKTNAFSKKPENHAHAHALYFFYYNFIREHKSLKTCPAVVCGVEDKQLKLKFILDLLDEGQDDLKMGGRHG